MLRIRWKSSASVFTESALTPDTLVGVEDMYGSE